MVLRRAVKWHRLSVNGLESFDVKRARATNGGNEIKLPGLRFVVHDLGQTDLDGAGIKPRNGLDSLFDGMAAAVAMHAGDENSNFHAPPHEHDPALAAPDRNILARGIGQSTFGRGSLDTTRS